MLRQSFSAVQWWIFVVTVLVVWYGGNDRRTSASNTVSALLITPQTPPETVVQLQLEALQKDDMETVYQFASPSNKQAMGPVIRFSEMVRSPPYDPLIHHSRASVMMTMAYRVNRWQCLVRVWDTEDSGPPKDFVWHMSKSKKDDLYFDCWMVDAVLPVHNW